jgi:PKD repeat protein
MRKPSNKTHILITTALNRLFVTALTLVFIAMLLSMNINCSKKKSSDPVIPGSLLTANFTASPLSGSAPLDVQFSDLSTGTVDTYLWDFGDGGTSVEASPLHSYTTNGAYTVTLSITGPGGSDSETRTGYIAVGTAPAGLQPESSLNDNLCNWPAQEFSPTNKVNAGLAFSTGQYAIDFTLMDPSGVAYNLGALLQTKPVVMIFGSCT